MGSQEEIKIENDFILIRFQNDGNESFQVKRPINQGLIQFHFGIKGKAKFVFNEGTYALELKDEKSLLFYNPQKELPLNLELAPNSWVISVIISIQKFHGLFSDDANHIPFLSDENKDRKYYKENEQFSVSKTGEMQLTLQSLAPRPVVGFVAVAIGFPVGTDCQPLGGYYLAQAAVGQQYAFPQISKGTYCLLILDANAALTATASFTLHLLHP